MNPLSKFLACFGDFARTKYIRAAKENCVLSLGFYIRGEMDVLTCDLPGITKLRSGKVREVFDLGDSLLLVATDRISAYDCILPNAIPHKGCVLTQLSRFWFEKLDFVPNQLVAPDAAGWPEALKPFDEILRGRSMIVAKAAPLPVECVVRGYLAGSGWKDYQSTGTICGHPLPPGLEQSAKLPEPIFTPASKADSGHDENISWNECRRLLGDDIALQVRDYSIELYEHGRAFAAQKGIIIADTKFEFGMVDGEVVLIDECLTPDSSRFWPAAAYQPGGSPPSYDKQYVRDYLETLDWDKTPPAPSLPAEVVQRTSAKYIEAFEQLVGTHFDPLCDGAIC
jgi:phosphoribosylaminoimidazole-succinocarboxamide synthase